jgi:hypothetical protein
MLQAGQPGVQFLAQFFSSPDYPDQLFSSLNLLLKRYKGFFSRVKNECSYTTTPPYNNLML